MSIEGSYFSWLQLLSRGILVSSRRTHYYRLAVHCNTRATILIQVSTPFRILGPRVLEAVPVEEDESEKKMKIVKYGQGVRNGCYTKLHVASILLRLLPLSQRNCFVYLFINCLRLIGPMLCSVFICGTISYATIMQRNVL